MTRMIHVIDAFMRHQEIERLNTKPSLTPIEKTRLHHLLTEEASSLKWANSLLRTELQRLNQLLVSNMH